MVSLTPKRLDLLFTAALLWFAAGAVADAYNHAHGAPISFFTIEHGIAYTAVASLAVLTGVLIYWGWSRGDGFFDTIPTGYGLVPVSILFFALGGFGDMLWHHAFGFEEASYEMGSPTHLMLGIGAVLLVSAPLRRAWKRGVGDGWSEQVTMLTSAALLLSVATFMMQHFHPFTYPFSASWFGLYPNQVELGNLLGIAGIMLHTIILMIGVFRLRDRFDLVSGGLVYIFVFNAVVMAAIRGHAVFVGVAVVAGILAELLVFVLEPDRDRPLRMRLFAFLVPVVLFLVYFVAVELAGGIGWSVHVWAGSTVLAGCTGFLVSLVVHPMPGRE